MTWASIGLLIAYSLYSVHGAAEVSGLDHLEQVSVTNCKPDDEEKPKSTPVGDLCSYTQVLCDVAAGGKTIFQGVYIDVDCVPSSSKTCPKIAECAKKKLPGKIADYVRSLNDPNSGGRDDGAGLDMGSLGGSR